MTVHRKFILLLSLLAFARAEATLSTEEAWGFGFLAGFCISMIGFIAALVLICFQKCLSETCFKHFVGMLYSLSCGAIIGQAMIHILPEAFESQASNPNYVSLIFICAIGFFIILERVFKACGISHEHWGDSHSDHGGHENNQVHNHPDTGALKTKEQKYIEDPQKELKKEEDSKSPCMSHVSMIVRNSPEIQIEKQMQEMKDSPEKEEEKSCLQNLKGKGAAGYLNLLSSFVHNFFDGFGIGVAFASRDKKIIVPLMAAIVIHEIPREMGDVGILIKNGFSGIQTVLCNGFINFMSLIGVFVGLALGAINEETQNYVLVFVAGNFMYIAADIWRHLLASRIFIVNVGEIIMFSLGVGGMYLVLLTETSSESHTEEQ